MGSHVNSDINVRRTMDCIRIIVQVLRQTAVEAEKKAGLTAAQLFVLQQMRDGEARSVNELAASTHTHQSSVSVVAQRLVDAELAKRQTSKLDARKVELKITAKGLKKLSVAPEAAQERLIAGLEKLPVNSRRKLAELMEELVRNAGAADKTPPLFFEEKRSGGKRNA